QIFLHDITAVTKSENKFGIAVIRLKLNLMTQNATVPDSDHRFVNVFARFTQAHPEPATEDHDFHAPTSASARSEAEVHRNDSSREPADCKALRRLIRK